LSQIGQAADKYALAKGGVLCAAGPKDKSLGPITLVGIAGSATCTSQATAPKEYMTIEVMATVNVKSTDADATKYAAAPSTHAFVIPRKGDVYFSAPTLIKPTSSSSVATFSIGNEFGGPDVGGYIGMASYLGVSGQFSFNENSFKVGTEDYTACAVPKKVAGDDTACGSKVNVMPGTFKYSLFGYFDGTSLVSLMPTYQYLGIRTLVSLAKMGEGATVMFNNMALSQIKMQQIKNMTIKGNMTTMSFEFPQWFNYGIIESKVPKKKGSEMVQIRYVDDTSSNKQFFIDYLFKKNPKGVGAKMGFFVYDPTVSQTTITTTKVMMTTTKVNVTTTKKNNTSKSLTGAGFTTAMSGFVPAAFVMVASIICS